MQSQWVYKAEYALLYNPAQMCSLKNHKWAYSFIPQNLTSACKIQR